VRFHPIADIFPMLPEEDLNALAADIQTHGLRDPIWIYEGAVLDGRNRWMACEIAGVQPTTRAYNGNDPVAFVLSTNLYRRHLTQAQKAIVASKAAKLDNHRPKGSASRGALSQDEAAEKAGVSRASVQRARVVAEQGVPELEREVWDGNIGLKEASEIARAPIEDQPEAIEKAKAKPHVANNTGFYEWYTPAEYVDAARKVMGTIDLDPASCPEANKIVKAKRIYTKEDDGLVQPWTGNVWLNPPYATGLIEKFAAKVAAERGSYSQLIAIVNNGTETRWFEALVERAVAICLTRGRVRFYTTGDVHLSSPLQGQAVVYVGSNVDRFVEVFSLLGTCWVKPHA